MAPDQQPGYRQRPEPEPTTRPSLSAKTQQAVELLQYPQLEVRSWLQEQLQANPLLDLEDHGSTDSLDKTADRLADLLDTGGLSDRTWDLYEESNTVDTFLEQHHGEVSSTFHSSLKGFLRWQARARDLDPDREAMVQRVIEGLDQEGFIPDELASEVSDRSGWEQAVEVVQNFDPPGIAARDQAEYAWLRLFRDQPDDQRPALDDFRSLFEDLQENYLTKIERNFGISRERLQQWGDRLKTLPKSPGDEFDRPESGVVRPDVYVDRSDGEWVVSLDANGTPPVRLNDRYRELLKSGKAEIRSYLADQAEDGLWLLQAIRRRNQTLYEVAHSIVRRQEGYFEDGIEGLNPLILEQVAEDVGVNESTVSRTVRSKYLQSPRGVVPLGLFINPPIDGESEPLSSTRVKFWLMEVIGEEDPSDPLSDRELATKLEERGARISRRTVAKYREQLDVPTANQRKRVTKT